ncbi:MAG: hypothetical protein LUE91_00480 [Oscillospiraceae bacterium]|nr:hypothetical protein [Oscillospiraceae bacterium]
MFVAPFHALAALIVSDGDFNFPEHLAGNFTDRRSQGIGGLAGVVVKDGGEFVRFKVVIGVLHTSAQNLVFDTDRCGVQEGHPSAVLIIPLQKAVRNDVGQLIFMLHPVVDGTPVCNILHLYVQRITGGDLKHRRQRLLHGALVFLPHLPEVHRAGIPSRAGVGHVKDVPQAGVVAAVVNEGDTLGTTFDVPPHGIVPEVVLGAGGGLRALGEDHKLVAISVLAHPSSSPQECRPLFPALGQAVGGFFRHTAVVFQFRCHVFLLPQSSRSG